MDNIIDNTSMFDREDDTPKQNPDPTPEPDAQDQPVDELFSVRLVQRSDGTLAVEVDGNPSLTDMEMLLHRAHAGVTTRIQAETTAAMLLNALGAGGPGGMM